MDDPPRPLARLLNPVASGAVMRMRQSLAQIEQAFVEEAEAARLQREIVQREAIKRSRRRQLDRVHKHGTWRFVGLVVVLIATAVLVTIAMFQTLYLVMG